MHKLIVPIIVLILVAVGAFVVTSTGNEEVDNTQSVATIENNPQNTDPVAQPEQEAESLGENYSISDIAMHATEDDCWTYIGAIVYDITPYVPRHPGGDEILRACGADGTSLFEARTTQDGETVGSGTPHSSGAANQLAQLQIGTLTE